MGDMRGDTALSDVNWPHLEAPPTSSTSHSRAWLSSCHGKQVDYESVNVRRVPEFIQQI